MPESEINRENVRLNFRDAQHLDNHHRFGAFWIALGLPGFLNLMNIEPRVIGSELGASLLFVLEPEVWRATGQFDSRNLTRHLFCPT